MPVTEDEFAELFRSAFRSLWLIAVGIVRDHSLAEDVVQEAAVTALRKLDQFDPSTRFVAWMGQIVRFTALNKSRKKQNRQTSPMDPTDLARTERAEPETPPLELTESGTLPAYQEHFDDRLLHGLEALAPIARTCLLLKTVQGLDYAQISEALGIPQGTAMSHVHRARKALRRTLSQQEEAA